MRSRPFLLISAWLMSFANTRAFSIVSPSIQQHHNHDRASSARTALLFSNIYDDWRSDAVVPTLPLNEDNVRECLDIFVQSDYGQQMFGCNEKAASVGITGEIQFLYLEGPEVVLQLSGSFWHRRETVLGRAAMWLNACMPEIVQVRVGHPQELEDFEEVVDDFTGEVLEVLDKRAPDFNGDRGTMEYQGIDPDIRGPFPPGVGDSFTINPM